MHPLLFYEVVDGQVERRARLRAAHLAYANAAVGPLAEQAPAGVTS
jgi:hypothetical protein